MVESICTLCLSRAGFRTQMYICLKDTYAHRSSTSVRKRLLTVLDNLLFVNSSLGRCEIKLLFPLCQVLSHKRLNLYVFFFLENAAQTFKFLTASVYWFCALVNIDIQGISLRIIRTTNRYGCLSHQTLSQLNTFIYL